ncbi:MAG: SCO family protein [Pseudomonadota bacterium]
MNKLFFVLVASVAATGGLWLSKQLNQDAAPPETNATVFQTSRPMPSLELLDQTGAGFTQEGFLNRWTLVFFGFTHCPDVCPTTLFLLTQVKKTLVDLDSPEQPHITMVSVDPTRDTPEQLANYLPHFGENITGLTGDISKIQALTQELGVAYSYTPDNNGGYTVDHTASIFLVSPAAELKAVFTTPHDAQSIATDYRIILKHYAP